MKPLPKSLTAPLATHAYRVGQRVQAHPATDTWMRGARYGVVVKVGRRYITVKMDAMRRPVRFHPDNLLDAT